MLVRIPHGSAPALVLVVAGLAVLAALAGTAPPAASAQVPPCVVGSWRATDFPEAMRAMMAEAGVVDVTGDTFMSIQPGGAYEFRMVDVTMSMVTEVGAGSLFMEGAGTGVLREVQPGMLKSESYRFVGTMAMTIAGQTVTDAMDFSSEETEDQPSPYECAGGRLVMMVDLGEGQRLQFPFARQ